MLPKTLYFGRKRRRRTWWTKLRSLKTAICTNTFLAMVLNRRHVAGVVRIFTSPFTPLADRQAMITVWLSIGITAYGNGYHRWFLALPNPMHTFCFAFGAIFRSNTSPRTHVDRMSSSSCRTVPLSCWSIAFGGTETAVKMAHAFIGQFFASPSIVGAVRGLPFAAWLRSRWTAGKSHRIAGYHRKKSQNT